VVKERSKLDLPRNTDFYGYFVGDEGDFKSDICECGTDKNTCLHAWCCLWCRAGDTYQASSKDFSYWKVIGFFMLSEFCGSLVANGPLSFEASPKALQYQKICGALVRVGILCFFFVPKRRELRDKLGGDNEVVPEYKDWLLYAFCTCCVVSQEARELDRAMGVDVKCCCNLNAENARGLVQAVGEPTGIASYMPCLGAGRKCCAPE